jgi:uncharacterized protein
MKPSRYNHLIKRRAKPQVLYNSRHHTLMELDQVQSAIFGGLQMPITRNLMNLKEPAVESLLQSLIQGGFFVEEHADELLELELTSNLFRFSRQRLDLWICLTTRCDRDCPDCPYRERRDLEPQGWDLIKRMIGNRTELRELSVTFWGGEPTLAWEDYLEFRGWLAGLRIANGLRLDVGLITNGGPAHLAAVNKHPKMVPGRILANLGHYEKSTSLGGPLAFLADLGTADAKRQYLSQDSGLRIVPNHPSAKLCRNVFGLCQTAPRFSDEDMDIVKGLVSQGVSLLNLPRPKTVSCQAVDHQSFIIDAEGNVFRCWGGVGLEECRVTQVMDDPFHSRQFKWMSWNPYRQPHCRICGLLPWCQGGCLAKPPDEDCGLWHFSKNDLLKLLVAENEKRAE